MITTVDLERLKREERKERGEDAAYQDLQNWLQQDNTKYFFKSLYNQREILKEELAAAQGLQGDFARGKIAAIQSILDTEAKEIVKDFINTVQRHYADEPEEYS